MSSRHPLPHRALHAALALLLTVAGGVAAPPVARAATTPPNGIVELSPTPPNVTQAVPPNIVVTFDDSGSMASNYMGDSRPFDGGSWSGPWRCAGVIDPRVTTASNVLSRAMNGVYYNPNVVYTPPIKADGTSFPQAGTESTGSFDMSKVPLDSIGINRPYKPASPLDSAAGYNNNPNSTTDPTGMTILNGVVKLTYPTVTTSYATFGTVCNSSADSGSCNTASSGTTGTSPNKTYIFYVKGVDATSGSGTGTVYSGVNLKTRNSSSTGYAVVTGDKTGVTPAVTKNYATWTVSTPNTAATPTLSNDNRWKCGYTTSPMNGFGASPDGTTYPNGGPYYYRYKSTAPTITVDAYGNPDSAGAANIYTVGNWEAVPIPNTTVTINSQSVNQWQNFANWYAYYRTRNLMTRSALSRVFGTLGASTSTGGFGNSIRAAWQNLYTSDTFHLQTQTIISSLLDLNSPACDATSVDPYATGVQTGTVTTAPNCYRSAFFNWIFGVPATSDTPTRASTIRVGQFFQRGYKNTGATGDLHDPYWQAPTATGADGLELVCRQNYHMLVTDGYWNETSNYTVTGINNATSSTTLPDGTAYSASNAESRVFWDVQGASAYTPSLANIGFNYWATNLRPDLYDPTNGKIVPPYMPDATTGVITGATSPALEKYFNPNNDPANWPHLVQYMVTLGVPGDLTYSADGDCVDATNDLCKLRRGQVNSSGKTGWTAPKNNDPTGIDDTWHSAINSRGAYFNAANPQNLVDQLTGILTNISARNVPATTSALNTSVLVQGALGFTAGYSSADWSGTFKAINVNVDGTVIGDQWDGGAAVTAADPTKRVILSATEKTDGSFGTGIVFKDVASLDDLSASTGSTYQSGKTLLGSTPASVDGGANDNPQSRLDWLRGATGLEGTTFRARPQSQLGAIINSQALFLGAPASGYRDDWPAGSPEALATANDGTTCTLSAPTLSTCHSYEAFASIYQNRTPTVYIGANDGMLHAFNASENPDGTNVKDASGKLISGTETFAYVPRSVYGNLGNLTVKTNFKFAPTVDATPVSRDVFFGGAWHTLLVGGLRLGGRGIYALDITDPSQVTEANAGTKVLWEFNSDTPATTAGDPSHLGYTFGQPNIGRLANGTWVVLVPGGYFPDCSKSDKPANCATIAASSLGYSSLFVLNAQTGALIQELKTLTNVTGVTSSGMSSAVLGDYNNDQIDDVAFAGDLNGNLWRFDLTNPDPTQWQAGVSLAYNPATQNAQPITDMPRLFPDPATNRFIVVFGTGKYLGAADNTSGSAVTQSIYGIRDKLNTSGTPLTETHADLQSQTLSEGAATNGVNTVRGLTDNALTSAQGGWYIDLNLTSSPGERVVVTPGALFDTNRALVTTLIPGTEDPCTASIGGALMVINAATGGSGGGLSGLPGPTSWAASGISVVGGLVNNPPTGGAVPVASVVGGGKLLIPGLQLKGGGSLSIDDAIWRRRSWRELNSDQ